jgi:hypothetical protein
MGGGNRAKAQRGARGQGWLERSPQEGQIRERRLQRECSLERSPKRGNRLEQGPQEGRGRMDRIKPTSQTNPCTRDQVSRP